MRARTPIESRTFGADRLSGWRLKVHDFIFAAETAGARIFDIALILVILASVVAVMLESIRSVDARWHAYLYWLEWGFTIIFTVEYVVRLISVGQPLRYARSFYGIVDILAVVPTYLSILLPGAQALIVVRLLRILRVFRVLKLMQYTSAADLLLNALRASRRKITIFIITVLTLVTCLGSMIYLIEGAENGFDNIPRSIYWAVVTLTTVGYGDISPQTPAGQFLAAIIMLIGYAIIAVPTGIVTAELALSKKKGKAARLRVCSRCYDAAHEDEAVFCKKCGSRL